MATLDTQGISLYYETHGNPANRPLLMISGLGGVGKSWGPQVKFFSENYYVILPDQRGTGQTTHADEGYSTIQLAEDMASLLVYLEVGPAHVIGASTGGAIAQYLALNHPDMVRSLIISSSFAKFDAFTHREFDVRRKMAADWDRHSLFSGYALFLFSPRFTRDHPEKVDAWINQGANHPMQSNDVEIGLKRIDMIATHDALERLPEIKQPTLVICGDKNLCTPLPLSEEIANAINGAKLVIIDDAGELIELEKPEEYYRKVNDFIVNHSSKPGNE